jgi:hypothetical protein
VGLLLVSAVLLTDVSPATRPADEKHETRNVQFALQALAEHPFDVSPAPAANGFRRALGQSQLGTSNGTRFFFPISDLPELSRRFRRRWSVTLKNKMARLREMASHSPYLTFFLVGIAIDFLWIRGRVYRSAIYDTLSFAILAIACAISGSFIAQARRIRKGIEGQTKIKIWPIVYLVGLAVFYSTPVEKWLWGLLEMIQPFASPYANAALQAVLDYFIVSFMIATPWSLYFYARNFDPRNEEEAWKEIAEKYLGYYLTHEWKWSVWIGLAMFAAMRHATIAGYILFQFAVLQWNINFDEDVYPTSKEKIEQIAGKWFGRWLAPPLRAIQRMLEHPWLRIYVKTTLAAGYILAIGDFIHKADPTSALHIEVMIVLAWGWFLWLVSTHRWGPALILFHNAESLARGS